MVGIIAKILIILGRPVYRFCTLSVGFVRLIRVNKNSLGYLSGVVFFVSLTYVGLWLYKEVVVNFPDINRIYDPPRMSSKILDREGRLLYKFYEKEDRSWIPLSKVPKSLVMATLAIEDKEFYNHGGVSWRGVLRAIVYNMRQEKGDDWQGGSTITQQLVKNVFLTNEKTWERKIKEIILSLLLEHKLTKNEILERYFNQVPYGGEVYGAEEAAMRYFGKHVWEIDMGEAAFMAGLPAAPSSYSPFGNKPNLAYLRQKHVIDEMHEAGFISLEEAEKLKGEKVDLVADRTKIIAPHFVFYIRDMLEERYGISNFGLQGLTVTTTLDSKIQLMAEEILKDEMSKIARLRINNGAVEVVGTGDGDILAMVGSRDYQADEIDGKFNVTTALRQPGSSIKPINYLLALQRGKSLSTIISDSPVTYNIKGQKPYTPRNYNGKFLGNVTLRVALASSLNIPSVKLLAENGVDNMIDLGIEMGITTWGDRSRYGLSLALGGGEVRMTDMAQAYSVFANLGEKVEINPVIKIENYLGETVYLRRRESRMIIEPKYAYLINSALSDNNARTPVFGPNSKLVIPGKTVAVKTGTTNSLKDNWCIGWTPSYLVAVWVGNNDGTPMSWVASGVTGATPIWNRIMTNITSEKENEAWLPPEGVYKASACGREEYFVDGLERDIKCPPPTTPTPIN